MRIENEKRKEETKLILRVYKPADCKALTELFYETVHSVNTKDYTKEQVDAWADGNVDLEKWNQSFLEHYTVIAEEENGITGFGDISDTGYLDRLYGDTPSHNTPMLELAASMGFKPSNEPRVPPGLTRLVLEL